MAVILLTISRCFVLCGSNISWRWHPQFISMYLLFCLLTNMMSIYAAVPIAAGSLKAANRN